MRGPVIGAGPDHKPSVLQIKLIIAQPARFKFRCRRYASKQRLGSGLQAVAPQLENILAALCFLNCLINDISVSKPDIIRDLHLRDDCIDLLSAFINLNAVALTCMIKTGQHDLIPVRAADEHCAFDRFSLRAVLRHALHDGIALFVDLLEIKIIS